MKLYLKKKYKIKNCKELLSQYFNDFCPSTFFDKEFTKIQCQGGSYRSISDLAFLCKTYFPSLSINKIYYHIVNFLLNRENYRKSLIKKYNYWIFISFHFCFDINKLVVHFGRQSIKNSINIKSFCIINTHDIYLKNNFYYRGIDNITPEFLIENYKKFKNA